jgi:hypothetical protein
MKKICPFSFKYGRSKGLRNPENFVNLIKAKYSNDTLLTKARLQIIWGSWFKYMVKKTTLS